MKTTYRPTSPRKNKLALLGSKVPDEELIHIFLKGLSITFNPTEVADNMKKYGGFIPGIRPGQKTADYIDYVLTRLTFGGALYISAISSEYETLR